MKESLAKSKRCQFTLGNGAFNIGYCIGSECMAWEPDHKRETKETIETIILGQGHEVDGWFVTGIRSSDLCTAWVRYVPLDSGDCGMKTKQPECGYPV